MSILKLKPDYQSILKINVFILLSICISPLFSQTVKRYHVPAVKFIMSSYGDYIYFLLNRKQLPYIPEMDSITGVNNIKELDALIALPEIITSAQISSYQDVYKISDKYYKNNFGDIDGAHAKKLIFSNIWPRYSSLDSILHSGELYYEIFKKHWSEHIKYREEAQIAEWKKQLSELEIFEKFFDLIRIPFRSKSIDIAAMAYHPAGSANYSPTAIYTSLFKAPDLPRVIGHEGTHLLLSSSEGNNWRLHPNYRIVEQLAFQNKIETNEIEETVCHFMQFRLSMECGLSPKGHISTKYPVGFRRDFIATLEKHWREYEIEKSQNIIDYMLSCAEETLTTHTY